MIALTPQIYGLCWMCSAAGLFLGAYMPEAGKIIGWVLLAAGAALYYGSAFYGAA